MFLLTFVKNEVVNFKFFIHKTKRLQIKSKIMQIKTFYY